MQLLLGSIFIHTYLFHIPAVFFFMKYEFKIHSFSILDGEFTDGHCSYKIMQKNYMSKCKIWNSRHVELNTFLGMT